MNASRKEQPTNKVAPKKKLEQAAGKSEKKAKAPTKAGTASAADARVSNNAVAKKSGKAAASVQRPAAQKEHAVAVPKSKHTLRVDPGQASLTF